MKSVHTCRDNGTRSQKGPSRFKPGRLDTLRLDPHARLATAPRRRRVETAAARPSHLVRGTRRSVKKRDPGRRGTYRFRLRERRRLVVRRA